MVLKSGHLGTVDQTVRSMALTITDPSHREAYRSSCHAFTARVIRDNPDVLPDNARILLLGLNNEVLHSIIVDVEGEILADTQRDLRSLPSEFDDSTGTYVSKIGAISEADTAYNVLKDLSVGSFRQKLAQVFELSPSI